MRSSTKTAEEGKSAGNKSSIKRRSILAAAGTGLATSLAGCFGGSDGGAGNSQTTASKGGKDFSGVTVKAADIGYIGLGPIAKQALKLWASRFEQSSGATVTFNFPSSENLLTTIKAGNPPHVWTGEPGFQGQLIPSGIMQGYKAAYQDRFPDYLDGGLMPVNTNQIEYIYSGWDDVYNLLMTSKPYSPFIIRKNHMEKARLSMKDAPTNYDELIDIATKLRDANERSLGFQCFAGGCDLLDVYLSQWMAANGANNGKAGYSWGDDWSTVNWRNDTWKEWVGKDIALFREHNLGAPNTPSMCDEPSYAMFLSGQLSIMHTTSANHKLYMNRAPDQFADGKIEYAPAWGGSNNIHTNFLNDGANFPVKPKGKDQASWDKSMEAAYSMVDFALNETEILNKTFPSQLAYHPSWKKHFENIPKTDFTTAGNWLSVTKSLVTDSDTAYGYEAHPLEDLAPGLLGAALQPAWKGQVSAEKALDSAASQMERKLKQSNEPWKNK